MNSLSRPNSANVSRPFGMGRTGIPSPLHILGFVGLFGPPVLSSSLPCSASPPPIFPATARSSARNVRSSVGLTITHWSVGSLAPTGMQSTSATNPHRLDVIGWAYRRLVAPARAHWRHGVSGADMLAKLRRVAGIDCLRLRLGFRALARNELVRRDASATSRFHCHLPFRS